MPEQLLLLWHFVCSVSGFVCIAALISGSDYGAVPV